MIVEALHSYHYCLEWVRESVADLAESDRARQFPGIPNHPAWTMGHLVYSAQSLGGEIGLEPWLEDSWGARFGGKSLPTDRTESYPSLATLGSALDHAEARVKLHCLELKPASWLEPLPDARFHDLLPSRGHAALQVLVGHTAFHAGQLSAWRRAMGLPIRAFV